MDALIALASELTPGERRVLGDDYTGPNPFERIGAFNKMFASTDCRMWAEFLEGQTRFHMERLPAPGADPALPSANGNVSRLLPPQKQCPRCSRIISGHEFRLSLNPGCARCGTPFELFLTLGSVSRADS